MIYCVKMNFFVLFFCQMQCILLTQFSGFGNWIKAVELKLVMAKFYYWICWGINTESNNDRWLSHEKLTASWIERDASWFLLPFWFQKGILIALTWLCLHFQTGESHVLELVSFGTKNSAVWCLKILLSGSFLHVQP